MDMKVLVTGGAGFIASHVVDLYLAEGYEVAVVDNLSSGRRSNLNPAAKFYEVDIRSSNLAEVFEKERPDFVNHHAAQVDVRRSVAEPLFDADVNIRGSINVLECARQAGVKKVVYISTGGAVYGEPEYLPCDEKHPINPICPYGASKHTVEHYLFMYKANYGLNYAILRYSNVYGPRQNPHGEAGVVAIFAGQMLTGKPVLINGDGEQLRDYVYVGDCARANVLVLTVENPDPVYNLASGKAASVNDVFRALKIITGYPREAAHGPAKLGETRHIYLNIDKAQRELGWRPQVSLEEGLQRVAEHFKAVEAQA
jgi:UDP-glucose 4-epimerase